MDELIEMLLECFGTILRSLWYVICSPYRWAVSIRRARYNRIIVRHYRSEVVNETASQLQIQLDTMQGNTLTSKVSCTYATIKYTIVLNQGADNEIY